MDSVESKIPEIKPLFRLYGKVFFAAPGYLIQNATEASHIRFGGGMTGYVILVAIFVLYFVLLSFPLVLAVRFRLSGKRRAFLICALVQMLFLFGHGWLSFTRWKSQGF